MLLKIIVYLNSIALLFIFFLLIFNQFYIHFPLAESPYFIAFLMLFLSIVQYYFAKNMYLIEQVNSKFWYIKIMKNSYYQFVFIVINIVTLLFYIYLILGIIYEIT